MEVLKDIVLGMVLIVFAIAMFGGVCLAFMAGSFNRHKGEDWEDVD